MVHCTSDREGSKRASPEGASILSLFFLILGDGGLNYLDKKKKKKRRLAHCDLNC